MESPKLVSNDRFSLQQALTSLTGETTRQLDILTWEAQQIYYVGKHGDDANTGLSMNQAFLTFGRALAVAAAQTPAQDNRFSILCEDAGEYVEDLEVPAWCGVIALGARIIGNHVVHDNSLLQSFRLVAESGNCITKSAGTGVATIVCPRMILNNGSNGVLCTAGSINYTGNSLEIDTGFGIGSTSTSDINASIEQIHISSTGIGIGIASSGGLDFKGAAITDEGNGTAIYVASTGVVHAHVNHVDTNTAFFVGVNATLGLITSSLVGARNGTGDKNITIAGFSKQQVSLVAAEESTNSGTFVRLGAGIFNADGYPAGATFTLRAACQVDNGQTYEVQVWDVTAGAYLTGTISDTNGSLEVKTLSLTLGAGERIYELRARLTTGSGGGDYVYVPSAFIDVNP
jgi:hypothetical protein